MRCRKCRQRFYSTDSPTRRVLESERSAPVARTSSKRHRSSRHTARLVRVLVTLAVFGVMFLIFFAFLHYLSIEHPGEDSSSSQWNGTNFSSMERSAIA